MQTETSRLTSGTETEIQPATGRVGFEIDANGRELDYTKRAVSIRDNHPTPLLATPGQFAARLDRIKARNGNNQPHPDAGQPYEQIPAADLRDTDVFASGLAVTTIERNDLITVVTLADNSGFRYGNTNPVLIQRRTTETVEAHQLRAGDVIVNSAGENIPVLLVMPHEGLVLVWTSRTNCFAMSRDLTVEIARRELAKAGA